jgi:hypothetical protein
MLCLVGSNRIGLATALAILTPAMAQAQSLPKEIEYENGKVTLGFDATVAAFSSDGTYWGIFGVVAPGSKVNHTWAEGLAKVGARIDHQMGTDATLYGGLSAVATFTLGEDVVATKDVSALSSEDAYVGVRMGDDGRFVDLSIGSQPYSVGTGMLIGDGAPEGSARGSVTLAPVRAWAARSSPALETGRCRPTRSIWMPTRFMNRTPTPPWPGPSLNMRSHPANSLGLLAAMSSNRLQVMHRPTPVAVDRP